MSGSLSGGKRGCPRPTDTGPEPMTVQGATAVPDPSVPPRRFADRLRALPPPMVDAAIAVVALVGAGTISLALAGGLNDVQLPYGQLVATYTFASLSPPTWRLLGMVGTVTGIIVSVLALGRGFSLVAITCLPFASAYALGTGARARRDRIAMLEERTRRLAQAHEAAAARERERIAREMHDVLAHSVSLIVVQAEAGPVVVRSDPDKAEAAFDAIAATGRDALGQLRRTLGVLRSDGPARH